MTSGNRTSLDALSAAVTRLAFGQVQGDRREWAWLFNDKTGFRGLLPIELPTFWTKHLSNAFAAGFSNVPDKQSSTTVRKGKAWSKEELVANVLLLIEGMSVRNVARVLGIPRSTVQDIVNLYGGRNPRRKKRRE